MLPQLPYFQHITSYHMSPTAFHHLPAVLSGPSLLPLLLLINPSVSLRLCPSRPSARCPLCARSSRLGHKSMWSHPVAAMVGIAASSRGKCLSSLIAQRFPHAALTHATCWCFPSSNFTSARRVEITEIPSLSVLLCLRLQTQPNPQLSST